MVLHDESLEGRLSYVLTLRVVLDGVRVIRARRLSLAVTFRLPVNTPSQATDRLDVYFAYAYDKETL